MLIPLLYVKIERLNYVLLRMTAFFDPGVQFGLQFRGPEGDAKSGSAMMPPAPAAEQNREKTAETPTKLTPATAPAATPGEEKPVAPGEVVSLDSFRKK